MEAVGVALFGLGRIGQIHLPNLVANTDVTVRWLVDVEGARDKAKELCTLHGLKDARFVPADDCEEVFKDERTQAVVIGVPTGFHEEIVKRSLRAGKHVFCEKPISFTAEAVKSCYDEASKNGRVLFCGFNRRFEPHHVDVRDQARSGQLGSPRFMLYHHRDPNTPASYISTSGGLFCDCCIHHLDYVPWVMGERPCSVVATGSVTSEAGDVYRAADDVDAALITLQFPSGAYATIDAARELPVDSAYYRIEVVGTKGSYFAQQLNDDVLSTVKMDGSGEDQRSTPKFMDGFKLEMDCFIRVVQGKEECPVPAEDVIQASVLANLCRTSLKEGRVVRL